MIWARGLGWGAAAFGASVAVVGGVTLRTVVVFWVVGIVMAWVAGMVRRRHERFLADRLSEAEIAHVQQKLQRVSS